MTQHDLILLGAAHVHLPDHLTSARRAGWTIAAVHDRDPRRAVQIAHHTGAIVLDDLSDLARHGRAAFVCSETLHHAEDVTAALNAGLHVFSEKPLTAHPAEAEALVALSHANDSMLETGFFLRSYPPLADMRAMIRAGRLGDPVHIRACFAHDGGYADWLDVTGWMSDPTLAFYGGFADEGVHVLDWLLWTFGDIRQPQAALGHSLGLDVDDHGTAIMRVGPSGTAVIEAGWTDTRMRLELDITCTKGGASLSGQKLRVWDRAGNTLAQAQLDPLDAGRASAAFLARCDEPDRPPLVPPEEAARATALLEALYATVA